MSFIGDIALSRLQRLFHVEVGAGFPIDRVDQRRYDDLSWEGEVVTCDIDRTYLATRFSSLGGIARIPLEFGIDKVDIAGMAMLLKELRRGPDEAMSRFTPLYFVSASPAQIRPVIERKMLLDGLEYDGTTFKRWGAVALSGKLARFREQLGYKSTALLMARLALPRGARDILIGDDIESDPWAFCAYADLLSGALAGERAEARLSMLGVDREDIAHILRLRERLGVVVAPVKRVMIRLERGEPERLLALAPRVRACRGAMQMALSAFDDGDISRAGLLRVVADLHARGTHREELLELLNDAITRALIAPQRARDLQPFLAGEGFVPDGATIATAPKPEWIAGAERDTWLPEPSGE
ncbi:MAG: hypothetical protein KAI47_08455 [Deltaproteobacteria bacterium]|nr:hypothetical protein [Deltaproteobacteria bacterium]